MEDDILQIIANPTRIKILKLLAEQPLFLSEISEILGIAKKAIIEHLENLESYGFVVSKRKVMGVGRPRRYFYLAKNIELTLKIGNSIKVIKIIRKYRYSQPRM